MLNTKINPIVVVMLYMYSDFVHQKGSTVACRKCNQRAQNRVSKLTVHNAKVKLWAVVVVEWPFRENRAEKITLLLAK